MCLEGKNKQCWNEKEDITVDITRIKIVGKFCGKFYTFHLKILNETGNFLRNIILSKMTWKETGNPNKVETILSSY